MSVITKRLDQNYLKLFVKGSPEKIKQLSLKSSLPGNFNEQLNFYSQKGYRILGLGFKAIMATLKEVDQIQREELEKDIHFLGFLILENKLKPVTTQIIRELQAADIKTVMVTGDNALTAISVARNSCIVSAQKNVTLLLGDLEETSGTSELVWTQQDTALDAHEQEQMQASLNVRRQSDNSVKLHLPSQQQGTTYQFALTGNAYNYLYRQAKSGNKKFKQYFQFILQNTVVFARMRPEDKSTLVTEIQKFPDLPKCGMCGDGANDCGALKTADVGISISEAEASIAAPFTSKIQDISCVIKLLREGRCALVTSFQCFKYMALYSMIQFGECTILYFVLSYPTDLQFLYWDLFVIIPLAFLMGMTAPQKQLSKEVPDSKLISFNVLLSVIGQSVI